MNWLKPVLIRWSAPVVPRLVAAQQRLLRIAGGGTWLSLAVLIAVALWGWIDPFGLRQRLDWMVADQFFRHRSPPALSPDLLQISIDDRAADELGFPVPRHVVARALSQLQSLGARVVMVDVVYAEPRVSTAEEEADRLFIPRATIVSDANLAAQFSEDTVLADAVSQIDSIVLAYYLRVPFQIPLSDEPALASMTRRLIETPTATAAELAERLRIKPETTLRLFDPALRAAFERLAAGAIRDNLEISTDEAVTKVFGTADVPAGVMTRFLRALDRARAESLLRHRRVLAVSPAAAQKLEQSDNPQLPVFPLAQAADWLGFADAVVDDDGKIRRLPMIKHWSNRLVIHEALAAAASQAGHDATHFRLESRGLRLHGKGPLVPLDSRGCMTINWPLNGSHAWDTTIPQISLADLVELDRYDFNVRFAKHKLREYVAQLDRLVPTGELWDRHFESILTAYSAADVQKAVEREEKLDRAGMPRVFAQPAVKDALDRAHRAAPEPPGTDPKLAEFARGVVDMQRQIESIEREQATVREELDRRVRGKLCLIGDTTTGSSDLKQTPVGSGVPGVAVIAAAANTILTEDYATVCGYPVSASLMLLIAGILFFPFFRLRPLLAGACAAVGCFGTIFTSFGLLAAADTAISPVTPVIGVVALYLTATTYQWLREYQQKKLVRTIFEAQTNPTIVERLIKAGQQGVADVLAPKQRLVTVFFAEIANFEELAQQVAAERLPDILARTFGTMNKLVLANEGTLDRYQGHAMVAFFGAPFYQPDHAQRACRAALECCDALRILESFWKEHGLPAPRIHVGLHTGELLVGNITLTTRVDYTVAGDNLNVAYRIGELNETYDTEVIMSEATRERCENIAEAREIDLVRIKGRREPIRAYELMSAKGRLTPDQLQLRGTFSTGLVAFRNRDYTSALGMFRTCRETCPGDRPATVYIERCEHELKQTMIESSHATGDVAATNVPTRPPTV